jgi:hypothetical protein
MAIVCKKDRERMSFCKGRKNRDRDRKKGKRKTQRHPL